MPPVFLVNKTRTALRKCQSIDSKPAKYSKMWSISTAFKFPKVTGNELVGIQSEKRQVSKQDQHKTEKLRETISRLCPASSFYATLD